MISVIIPTYNNSLFLFESIESVINQTFKDFEIIIVDDGSTDETPNLIAKKDYQKTRYYFKDNGGVASARNLGIKMSKGSYIAFLDSDDLWIPTKLGEIDHIIRNFQNIGLIHSNAYLINEGNHVYGEVKSKEFGNSLYFKLLMSSSIITSSIVLKKECFDKCGLFYEGFDAKAGAEDWDMWIRVSKHFESRHIDKCLLYYRTHKSNTSTKEFVKVNRDLLVVLDRAFKNAGERELKIKSKAYGIVYLIRGRKYFLNLFKKSARRELIKSIKYYPFIFKSYIYFLLTLFPKIILRVFIDFYKRHTI